VDYKNVLHILDPNRCELLLRHTFILCTVAKLCNVNQQMHTFLINVYELK